jgi:hypothetical protein
MILFLLGFKADCQVIDWYGSQILKEKPFIPDKDNSGNKWYDYTYDDNSWISLNKLPDKEWGCNDCDRYYRGYINLETDDLNNFNYFAKIEADDGIWIYINGNLVGHWGGEMHKGPCVNCHWGSEVKVEPIFISEKLQSGKNVIAVHVSNGPGDSYFNLDITTNMKRK